MIQRGKRLYVQLAAIGECDDAGKSVLQVGFKGKQIAEPDRPLLLAVGIIEQIATLARYSSEAAARADLDELTWYVNSLRERIIGPEPKEAASA